MAAACRSAFLHRQPSSSRPLLTPSTQRFVINSSPVVKYHYPPRISRRIFNYTQEATLVAGPRHWAGANFEEEVDSDDEEDDRSLDLLVRFVQNIFRKVSRRARKAVLSVLPVAISPNLVHFSVNGVLILTFLWVLKAFLEVVCTLGSIVFVSILLVRGVWAGITSFQENHYIRSDRSGNGNTAWTSAQPVT